MTTVA
jgi:hypothetical protein